MRVVNLHVCWWPNTSLLFFNWVTTRRHGTGGDAEEERALCLVIPEDCVLVRGLCAQTGEVGHGDAVASDGEGYVVWWLPCYSN